MPCLVEAYAYPWKENDFRDAAAWENASDGGGWNKK